MARNLNEPGANEDRMLELIIHLKNARAFAGHGPGDEDWDWREGDWRDPGDVDLYDWERRDTVQGPRNTGTYGKYAQQIASGGRVGFDRGTNLEMFFKRVSLDDEAIKQLKLLSEETTKGADDVLKLRNELKFDFN